MPKKIFNSDIETSGRVLASTLTDGTATLSGGVLTANTLTDGTATLSGGVLTANTLTDGTATLSGGALVVQDIQASNISGNDIRIESSADITLTPAQADGQVYVTRDSADDGPIGLTIRKPVNGSAYLSVVEGTTALFGGRLAYEGAAGDTPDLLDVGVLDTVALQALNGSTTRNVLSYKYTGADVVVESTSNINLKPGLNSLVSIRKDTSDGSPVGLELVKPTAGSAYITLAEQSPVYGDNNFYGARFAYEGDGVDEGLDVYLSNYAALQGLNIVASTDVSGNVITDENGDTVYETEANDVLRWYRSGSNVKLQSSTNLELFAGDKITMELEHTDVGSKDYIFEADKAGTLADDYQGSFTAVRSYRDVHLVAGMGYGGNDDLGVNAAKISIRKPTWSLQGHITGDTEVAYIDSNGNASFDRVTADELYLPNIPVDSGSPADIDVFHIGVDPSNGRVYKTGLANYYFFTGHHVYAASVELPIGASVQIVDGEAVLTSTTESKTCCGIVSDTFQCTSEKPLRTSMGNTVTSGFIVRVMAVGDSRSGSCQGFNVCNENGDIQPGDLLVTSSTPGYLMKQDDDIIRSKTVGKAMEAVTFDANGQATGIYGFIYCG